MSANKSQPFYATWWFEWLFMALCFVAGWFLWEHVRHHWAVNAPFSTRFLELGRSLASGHGYTLTQGGAHVPYLETPPLYPALLALVMLGVGATQGVALSEAFLALNLALYLLSIVLAYAFLSRRIKKPYCFYITALYAASPLTLSAAQGLTPAMTYLIVSMLALVAIDKYFADRKPTVNRWPMVWTCLCVVAALATKNLGLALLGAFLWMAFTKLPFKQAATVIALIALVMSPWITRDILYRNSGMAPMVVSGLSASDPQARQAMPSPLRVPSRFDRQLWDNADALSADLTDALLGTVNFRTVGAPLAQEVGLSRWSFRYADVSWIRWALGALVLMGLGFGLYQFSGVGALYLLLFLATSLVLPLESSLSVFPVLPLALFFLYTGVLWLAHGIEKIFQAPTAHVAFPLLTVLIAMNSVDGHLRALAQDRGSGQPSVLLPPSHQTLADAPSRYARATRWLRANTAPSARIMASQARAIERDSGRQARAPLSAQAPARLARQLVQRADYVVEDPQGADDRLTLVPAIEAAASRLRLAFNDPQTGVRIWQVVSNGSPSPSEP